MAAAWPLPRLKGAFHGCNLGGWGWHGPLISQLRAQWSQLAKRDREPALTLEPDPSFGFQQGALRGQQTCLSRREVAAASSDRGDAGSSRPPVRNVISFWKRPRLAVVSGAARELDGPGSGGARLLGGRTGGREASHSVLWVLEDWPPEQIADSQTSLSCGGIRGGRGRRRWALCACPSPGSEM